MATRKKLAHRILGVCVRHSRILSILLYIAAFASFLSLPVFVKRNYLDENALLAGFAHSQIRYSSMLPEVTDSLRSISDNEQDPHELATKLLDFMHVPYWHSPAHFSGCNASVMHSILHASRGDGKEALVLVTPVNGSNVDTAADKAGVHVGMAVMRYLQHVPWLAKDVIWVVPDVSCSALSSMQVWLDMYHGSNRGSRAFGQAGLIQQALVLQMSNDRFNTLKVNSIGWNGRVPMLDLFYLVRRVAEIGPGLDLTQITEAPLTQYVPERFHAYWLDLWRALCFSGQQAIGTPTGIHAEFTQYGIDAVTIQTTLEPSKAAWSYSKEEGITKLSMLLELTVRSLNNLLERFHHSTTFYILLSPDWHIPFQTHILPPLLLTVILALQAADAKCFKGHPSTQAPQAMVAGTYGSWTQAIKHMLSLHLLCRLYNHGLLACSHRIFTLVTFLSNLVPYTSVMTCIVVLSVFATAMICLLAQKLGYFCQPLKQTSRALRVCQMQKIGLSLAAAQSAALLCVDWAAAFFILLPLVPVLTAWPDSELKSSHCKRVILQFMTLKLTFCVVFACMYACTSVGMYKGLQELRPAALGSVLSTALMHETFIVNALLTTLLPCCLAVLTTSN